MQPTESGKLRVVCCQDKGVRIVEDGVLMDRRVDRQTDKCEVRVLMDIWVDRQTDDIKV